MVHADSWKVYYMWVPSLPVYPVLGRNPGLQASQGSNCSTLSAPPYVNALYPFIGCVHLSYSSPLFLYTPLLPCIHESFVLSFFVYLKHHGLRYFIYFGKQFLERIYSELFVVCRYVNMNAVPLGGQEGVFNAKVLELQVIVSYPMWVLGITLGSSARVVCAIAFNH